MGNRTNGSTGRSVSNKFIRFAGVGVFGTAAHYLVLVLMVESLGARPVFASCAGFLVGALVNYSLNYRFTFQSNRRHRKALPRFYLVATVGFILNAVIMMWLAEKLGLPYILAQITATGLVLVWGFTANSLWTFGHAGAKPPSL